MDMLNQKICPICLDVIKYFPGDVFMIDESEFVTCPHCMNDIKIR